MSLTPYFEATAIIQFHVLFAATGLFLGPFVMWRKRRDRLHKMSGYVWVVTMALAAITALFIPSHFSPIGLGPIHLLSFFTLWGLFEAMTAIFRKDIRTHEQTMKNLYVRGVCLAGAFNFLPGRTTQRALIPEHEWIGFVIIAAVLVWAFVPLFIVRIARTDKKTLAVQSEAV